MKLGKRRKDDDPADEPLAAADADVAAADADVPRDAVTETWTAPAAEPVPEPPAAPEPPVDSHAVELPPPPVAMPAPVAPVPPVPLTMTEPVARPAPSGPAMPPPVAHDPAIAMTGAVAPGHGADPLMDEIRVLAAERPEYVVGAAFAGGILAAMILRRLGN